MSFNLISNIETVIYNDTISMLVSYPWQRIGYNNQGSHP